MRKANRKKDGKIPERIMSTVISITLTALHDNWRTRCKERHRPEQGRKAIATHVEVTREITFLYSMKGEVCIEDQIAFEKPLKTMLDQPIGVMKTWLNNWRDVIPASVSQAEKTSKMGTKSIYTYMLDPEHPENNMDRRPKRKVRRRYNKVKRRSEGFITNHFHREPNKRSTSVHSSYVPTVRRQLPITQMLTPQATRRPSPRRDDLHKDHPG